MSASAAPQSSGRKSLKTAALLWFLAVSMSIGLMAFLKAPAIVVALAILLTSFT
jgi:hypothetical protein